MSPEFVEMLGYGVVEIETDASSTRLSVTEALREKNPGNDTNTVAVVDVGVLCGDP